MQNCPYTNPTGGCPTGSSRWSACKTARIPTRQAGAPLRERDFACKTARAPVLTTALRMTELRPGASTSPARSRANAGPHRGRQQATGAGNRAMETAHRGRQQATGAGNLPTPIGGSLPHCPYPAPIQLTALGRAAPSTRHRLDQYRGAHDRRRAEHTHHRRAEHPPSSRTHPPRSRSQAHVRRNPGLPRMPHRPPPGSPALRRRRGTWRSPPERPRRSPGKRRCPSSAAPSCCASRAATGCPAAWRSGSPAARA